MSFYRPRITSVTVNPNPVNINSGFQISASAEEIGVTSYKISKIAGPSISGQVITLNYKKEIEVYKISKVSGAYRAGEAVNLSTIIY